MKTLHQVSMRYDIGEPVKFISCPPGLFLFAGTLALKTDYNNAFIVDDGDAFWGGTATAGERDELMVSPLSEARDD